MILILEIPVVRDRENCAWWRYGLILLLRGSMRMLVTSAVALKLARTYPKEVLVTMPTEEIQAAVAKENDE